MGDSEAQDYPRDVIVQATAPHPDLTRAFANPLLLRGTTFESVNQQFILRPSCGTNGRPIHAILIKTATCRATVAVVLVVVIACSIAAGLIAGYSTGDVKIGLAVCAAAIGIFALIQASLFGVDSLRSKTSH